jgi:hypothetical protein
VDSSGKDVIVTFGDSKKRVWKIAQEEIKPYRQRVKQLSGKEFKDIDPLKEILQLYLGKTRPLIQLMEFSLNLLHKKVMPFLHTYCVQKSYHPSVSELYDDEDDRVKTLDLMLELEYRAIWELIAKTKTADDRNKKHFWEKFQQHMNEMFNEVDVRMLGLLLVSLDDDKKKASVGKGKDMQGLKQHILTDRRKCILGHTAVSPATLFTFGVCWEMEGESSYNCYMKLVKEIFRIKLMLDMVTFCSD